MRVACGLLVLTAILGSSPLYAQDGVKKDGVLAEKTGAVMLRTKSEWKPLQTSASVKPGDFLVALPDATLKAKDGSVELHMVADIGNHGSFPVLESAITWGGDPAFEIDAVLHRGVVLLKAPREKTKARLKFADQTWVFTFLEPDTAVAVESYGRIAPGAEALGKYMREGFKQKLEPNYELAMLVVKGKVFVDFGPKGVALSAPPGSARVSWNNVSDRIEVSTLEKTPVNVTQDADEKVKQHLEKIRKGVDILNKGITGPALVKVLLHKDVELPKLGVVIAGALDRLDGLTLALAAPRQDVREAGIRVLRHWLGREEDQLKRLNDFLVEKKGLTPVQARNFLQLVIGFDERERADPETYSLLIHNLTHKHIAVRELCHWHLVRLVPDANKIPFDAMGAEAALAESQRQFLELIPAGKVPMAPETAPKGKQVNP